MAVALVLGIPTASAQAPASSWRSAARAALAFGHAEGQMHALRRFTVKSAPRTKQEADAVFEDLDQHAQRAREAYLAVERHGSLFWTAAAAIRLGDTFLCQGDKIFAIPVPPQVSSAAQRMQRPDLLTEYLAVLQGLSEPLRDQASRHWRRVAADENVPDVVARRARERLAGTSLPDC